MLFKRCVQLLCIITMSDFTCANNSVAAATRPVVIELFTSQGCNSCPPADTLLGEYANNPNVIALAFHVDYWDYLGWRDPFALPIGKQRQLGYVQSLQLSSAFTPQSIIDGRTSMVGSDHRGLVALINEKHDGISLSLTKASDTLTIVLPESESSNSFDVSVVAYQTSASTSVPRGENSGHTLKEYNIVRFFKQLDPWNGHAAKLNMSLSAMPSGANRLAVLIQKKNQGAIVGAAAIAL